MVENRKLEQFKRIIPAVTLVVSLALGVSACNSSSDNPTSYDPNTDPAPALSVET